MSPLGQAAVTLTTGILFYGAFSRLTHGRYTPSFYRYQLDRAPDDESTRIVPLIDLFVGTLLIFPRTRLVGAGLSSLFHSFGLPIRFKSGKPAGIDLALWALAVFGFLDMLLWT